MTLKAAFRRLLFLLLSLIPSATAQASAALRLQIAQARANESVPGGVEHRPAMEPDATAPAAVPLPVPTMPATGLSPPATLAAPPQIPTTPPAASPAPVDADTDSHEKKVKTKPESASKKKATLKRMEVPMTAPGSSKDDDTGGDERHPGGVEHAPSTDH